MTATTLTSPPTSATDDSARLFGRWLGVAGIVYVLAVLGGHIAHDGAGGDELSAYADYVVDDDRMTGASIQAVLAMIGLGALVIFAVGFAQRHRHARPPLATLATAAAVAYGALWTVGVALITAAGQAAKLQADVALSAESAQALDIAGSYLLYWAALSVAGIWILASVHLAKRADAYGRWLTGFGYIAGVALLPGFIWVGLPLHMIWVLIVSVLAIAERTTSP